MTSITQAAIQVRRAPAVVVGSGIAGLSTALGLPACLVVTRGELGSGSSGHAQGGIAAALSDPDTPAEHAADTVAVAGEIADPGVVRSIVDAAPGRIEWLTALGACFDRDADGALALGREAGHSAHRVVHAHGDATGAEVMRALVFAVAQRPEIEYMQDAELVDLIRSGSRVVGILTRSKEGSLTAVLAPAVVLATGGIGGLYARTTNPAEVRGDGLAAAARAGAMLADLEFVQFHPTSLAVAADPAPLLTEALRGEGAVLVNESGTRFMPAVHPDAELAPRDVVARAIWRQRMLGRQTFLDARSAVGDAFPGRFPSVWKAATAAGFDPRVEPLPVTPAEHYFMGGIATDSTGRSSLPGLWVVGEAAATGLHGANRLASNSLLEGMVLGAAAARSIAQARLAMPSATGLEVAEDALTTVHTEGGSVLQPSVRALMWKNVGLVRNDDGLVAALVELEELGLKFEASSSAGDRNLLLAARLITNAALLRAESRGAHFREDYPNLDSSQQHRSQLSPPPAPTIRLPIRPGGRSARAA